jgi:GNAT superfamily N-acetyltransferase
MKIDAFACDESGAERISAVAGADRLPPAEARRLCPDLSLAATGPSGDRACASIWWRDVPALPGHRVGVVGHYAAADVESGAALLASACDALRAQGATLAVGPMDANTWHRYRLVTWRAKDPPFLLEPDNPDSWGGHFERAGFSPLAGYHSACCDDLAALPLDAATAERLEGDGFRIRTLDRSRMDTDLHLLWAAAGDAFSGNFLYTPVAEAEFRSLYANAIGSVPPQMVTIAEHAGRIAGFLFAYPDSLQAARGDRIDTVVLKTLGVVAAEKRIGIGRWLFDRAIAAAHDAGFRRAIFALIHDDNPSARLGREQRRLIRRYTLYGRPL